MRATSRNVTGLIAAARDGDARALDELVAVHLPLVYTIVRRSLGDDAEVDDVVQETMLSALRELQTLRTPESFRPWLVATAMRRVRAHLRRQRAVGEWTVAADELAEVPEADADLEGATSLRLRLSDQRRQVVRASRWLDPDDRALLSTWWLEVAGRLTRSELAAALGMSVAHTAVRVQRMRNQLDLSRSVVAALDAEPRCADLAEAVVEWDGSPSSLWRKRIARHVRSCPVCSAAADGLIAPERLLAGVGLLSVPMPLSAAMVGNSALTAAIGGGATTAAVSGAATAGVKGGFLVQLAQVIGAHPVAAVVAAGTLVAGAVVTTAVPPSARPSVMAAPTSSPTAVAPRPTRVEASATPKRSIPAAVAASSVAPAVRLPSGPVSLESVNQAGLVVATGDGGIGVLQRIDADNPLADRQRATFEVVAGLAGHDCVSFRARDGRYLRHKSWQLDLDGYEDTELYREDATFCVRGGAVPGSVSLQSFNYSRDLLRHRGNELWVDPPDGSAAFVADASFRPRPPLAR